MIDRAVTNGVKEKMTEDDTEGYTFKSARYYGKIIQDDKLDDKKTLIEEGGHFRLEKKNEATLIYPELKDIVILRIVPGRNLWVKCQVECRSIDGKTARDGTRCGSKPKCAKCSPIKLITIYDIRGQYLPTDDEDKTFILTATKGTFISIGEYLREQLDNSSPHFYLTSLGTESIQKGGYKWWGLTFEPTTALSDDEMVTVKKIREGLSTQARVTVEDEEEPIGDEGDPAAAERLLG